MLKHNRLRLVTKFPVSWEGTDPDEGREVCLDREGRGAEPKAVKEERPAPLVGKSREHLRARLQEKLSETEQSGAGRDKRV